MPQIEVPELKVVRRPLLRIAAAAAVILVLVVAGVFVFNRQHGTPDQVVVNAPEHGTQVIELPDRSKVTLREGSSLQFAEDFEEREVVLTGEAFFDVTPDETRPFSVLAGNGNIRVLGTRFNVKAFPDSKVELYVEEGRVAFAPNARRFDARIFSEGQAGVLVDSAYAYIERTAAPGVNAISWISGRLVFDHVTLDHVLADVSRHFLVDLRADPTLYSCELKADFYSASLDDIFETLRFSLNLNIEKADDTYVISGQPCATDSTD
jgi:ferric-dicitrate binding protein FerR (iron transport regulator)